MGEFYLPAREPLSLTGGYAGQDCPLFPSRGNEIARRGDRLQPVPPSEDLL
jgi:hypothetical protein